MSENGFTLIEILIAITITGIILTAVFMFLEQGLFTWGTVQDKGDWEQNWRVFNIRFQNDINNLFYTHLYKDNIFEGDYQGINLIIKKEDVLKEVTYRIDYNKNSIIREEKPYSIKLNNLNLRDINSWESDVREEIEKLEFFSDFDFFRVDYQYFDPQNNYWVSAWSIREKDYLPSENRI